MSVLSINDIIIAFDPGATTGVVVAQYIGNRNFDILFAYEIKWYERFIETKNVITRYSHLDPHVICEDFRIRRDFKTGEDQTKILIGDTLPASRMIGVIETRCYDDGLVNMPIMQQPAIKIRVGILDRHANLVLPKVFGGRDHVCDAYQHVRYYITQQASKARV